MVSFKLSPLADYYHIERENEFEAPSYIVSLKIILQDLQAISRE